MLGVGCDARGKAALALLAGLMVAVGAPSGVALADIAVVGIDRKVENVGGRTVTVQDPAPDTAMILDLSTMPPTVLGEVEAPTSVVGPPSTVAVSPDQTLAIVTGGRIIDPDNPTGLPKVADDVTVIDLTARPPEAVARLKAGAGAAGVSFTPDGAMALIANRNAGTVSVLGVDGTSVTLLDTVEVGDERSGPSPVAVSRDGRTALVTLDAAHGVAVLDIDGTSVSGADRLLTTAVRPYGMAISPDGSLAAVANLGRTQGDVDTVSIVDMTADPIRVVDTVSVGLTPEDVTFSPDGRYLAVGIMNGSQFPPDSPFYNDGGRLILYEVDGTGLRELDEIGIGSWSQGVVFTSDGRHLLVQAMIDQDIMVIRWDGERLTDTGHRIDLQGGGAAMATAH
jgi:DNA-binding beta-propeller fold protein YncE